MTEGVEFQGKIRKINIPQEIGIKYRQFGVFLLQDDNGTRVDSIAHKHMNDAEQINKEVLEEWIAGRGKHPVTWQTLAEVLHGIKLRTLAREIEAVKCQHPVHPTPGPFGYNHDIPEDENIGDISTGISICRRQGDTTVELSDSEQKRTRKTLAKNIMHVSTSVNDQADQPTLSECISFQGRENIINIPQEIGIKYHDFGVHLLEDDTGARIRSIAHKNMNDAEEINIDVLIQWINGTGKHPVTWKTLTQVLHDIELSNLAGEIEAVKCPDNTVENNTRVVSVPKCLGDVSSELGSQQSSLGDISPKDTEDVQMCKNLVDIEDLTRKENQKSSVPHGAPPVERGLRDIITQMINSSEQRSIGDIPASDTDDDKYYGAVQKIADIVCSCVQQLKEQCSPWDRQDTQLSPT